MANWVQSFLNTHPEYQSYPVYKRTRHSIHFKKNDGQIEANFTGLPCHYLENNEWKPLDTTLVEASGGFCGAPGLDIKIHTDGRVTVDNSTYYQYTELPGAPTGYVDGDKIVREFTGGRQYLYLRENGFKNKIILDRLPSLANRSKLLATTTGSLPIKYIQTPMTAIDANGSEYVHTTATAFRNWLSAAAYPVTIDPDFAESSGGGYIYGLAALGPYSSARADSDAFTSDESGFTVIKAGQSKITLSYTVYKTALRFDTSGIDDGATINQVNLKLTASTSTIGTNFVIEVVEYDWSACDPLSTYRETFWDAVRDAGSHIDFRNTSDGWVNTTQYTSSNLTTSWVSKTGTTYYALRSDQDAGNVAPTGVDVAEAYGKGMTTESYRPVLTVLYTVTYIKTILGLAKASVKVVDGLAIASVKTFDGLE